MPTHIVGGGPGWGLCGTYAPDAIAADLDGADCLTCWAEQDRHSAASAAIDALDDRLNEAGVAVQAAIVALEDLRGTATYSLGYAEGTAGADMLEHLRAAALSIRTVAALHTIARQDEGC